jgi:hypothetical protein
VIKDFPEGVEGFEYSGAAEFDMSWSQECRDQVFVSNSGTVMVFVSNSGTVMVFVSNSGTVLGMVVCSCNFGACSRNFGAVL